MEITRTVTADALDVAVEGRLDGYWADHLDSALSEAVREGHHRIRLDCAKVTFLSSASIGVLMKMHKELARIEGTFTVVNPSPPVLTVLRITRLAELLMGQAQAAAPVAVAAKASRQLEREGIALEIFDLDARASLTCRSIGSIVPAQGRTYTEADCVSLEGLKPAIAVAIGAFGDGFAECRARFGEMISVAGATAYLPGDSTNVPDYLIASGGLGADIRALHCLSCEGSFSHLVRFDGSPSGTAIGVSTLVASCLDVTGMASAGVVILAEASGLVGAALRRSPAEPGAESDFFDHPGVRSRLTFTAERAFTNTLVLAAGIVERGVDGSHQAYLRPIGAGCSGHLHAAAFRFSPLRKGFVDMGPAVSTLFDRAQLLGVLHLLHDDRGSSGTGESEVVRGACWLGPIAAEWQTS